MKVVLGVAAVVLMGELVWAGWTLTKTPVPPPPRTANNLPAITKVEPKTTITLSASSATVKIGQKVAVNIEISTNRPTDGTDLIILYNPKLLSVVPNGTAAVSVGTLYGSYPINKFDDKAGQVMVSGISTQGGVIAQGNFGSLEFSAKAAGKVAVALDFTRGSTTDSNVIESKTARDILTDVRNVEVTIIP